MAEQSKSNQGNNSNLRFAVIIRVSTEEQDKQGESLLTQRDENIRDVDETLGGKIVAWYGGQEHATPGYEKKEINRSLRDAEKKSCIWNAVKLTNVDRWSRDNVQSKIGLRILRDNNKRFFTGTQEWDLWNPVHIFFLGVSAEVGELVAAVGNEISRKNRKHRAERGYPTSGKFPPFRIFDKKRANTMGGDVTSCWSLDEERLAEQPISEIARRYLAGESMEKLAIEYKFSLNTLWDALTKYSGDIWIQSFYNEKKNIRELVETTVPELLPAKTIVAIRRKAEAHKTYDRKHIKNKYLLSGMVFCEPCGYSFSGSTNTANPKFKYYKHIRPQRMVNCNCDHAKRYVPVGELEENVLRYLFDMFGNAAVARKAIQDAIPNRDELASKLKRKAWLEKEVVKVKKGLQRIAHQLGLGNDDITDEAFNKELALIKKRLSTLITELDRINENIDNMPNPDTITKISKLIADRRYLAHHYEEMTWENKRELCQMIFSGKRPDGKRMGVWIKWNGEGYSFSLHGHLVDEIGMLPLSPKQRAAFYENGGGYKQKQLSGTESGRGSTGASRRTLTPRGENNCCTHGLKGTSR